MIEWLRLPESKTLEFKRDLSSPKPLLKTVVAFANAAGGRLVIGIDDDRQVVGIANPLDEEERLCSLIADSIAPRLVPNVELLTVEGKTLLVLEVFVSGSRPHWLESEGAEAGVYVRLGSTNRQADAALIGELRRSAEGVAFDEMPMPELGQDDLDLDVARRLFEGISPLDPQTLRTLKLLTKYQQRWVPTKGAVLLFGKQRTQHFSDAWVQCGRFVGGDKARIFDHIDIYDPLPAAVDGVMLFLKKHAMRGAELSATRRRYVWSIPLVMLREAVINELVHADYSQRGAPIRVSFFDDRIEVESPCILLPGADRGGHASGRLEDSQPCHRPRVPRTEPDRAMGQRHAADLPRGRGTGPARAGNHGSRHAAAGGRVSGTGDPHRSCDRASNRASKATAGMPESGAARGQGNLDTLSLKHRPTVMANYLSPVLTAGLVEMTQPDSPRSPTQKYRLRRAS